MLRQTALFVSLLLALQALASQEAAFAQEAAKEAQAETDEAAEAVPGIGEAEAVPPGYDRLDPEVRKAIDAMDDAALQALMERASRGEELDVQERAILEGMAMMFRAQFDAQLAYQTGDVVIGDGLAVLHLGDAFRYLSPDDAHKVVVDMWGNPPGMQSLGMIVPAEVSPVEAEGWGVIITYSEDGYVSDEDAEDLDYDQILAEMQKDTAANNEYRVQQGYERLHLVGWAEPPHYDRARHNLYWAKELATDDAAAEHALNYAIRVLGRRGVLEFNAVSGISQMAHIKPEVEKLLGMVEFSEGNRYSDFDPSMDKVAAYGIGGLILGKAAAKVGLLAVLLKFLLAAKKFLLLIVIGAFAGIKMLLGRKRRDEDEVAEQQQQPSGDPGTDGSAG